MGSLLSFGCSVGMWDSLRRASTIRWALDLLGAIEVAASQRGRGAEGEARERERPTLMVLTTARRARLSLADASQNHRSDQEGWEAPGPRGSRNDVQLLGPSAPGRQALAVG